MLHIYSLIVLNNLYIYQTIKSISQSNIFQIQPRSTTPRNHQPTVTITKPRVVKPSMLSTERSIVSAEQSQGVGLTGWTSQCQL